MTLDRPTVLSGLPAELRAFGKLISPLGPEGLRRPTRCSGWDVADVAGHVVGTVVDVNHGHVEGQGTAAVTERQARERTGRTGAELADELAAAVPTLIALLESMPEDSWTGPSLVDPAVTLGFSVEALWFDAYLHGDDIRAALGAPSERGPGLRCAVHHVAGYLTHRGHALRLRLDGTEPIDVASGDRTVTGDPLEFVLAATGRGDPEALGLDDSINVYLDGEWR